MNPYPGRILAHPVTRTEGGRTVELATLAPYGIPVAAGVVAYLIRRWWHGPPGPEGDTLVAL
jgi:hypothetical protein